MKKTNFMIMVIIACIPTGLYSMIASPELKTLRTLLLQSNQSSLLEDIDFIEHETCDDETILDLPIHHSLFKCLLLLAKVYKRAELGYWVYGPGWTLFDIVCYCSLSCGKASFSWFPGLALYSYHCDITVANLLEFLITNNRLSNIDIKNLMGNLPNNARQILYSSRSWKVLCNALDNERLC